MKTLEFNLANFDNEMFVSEMDTHDKIATNGGGDVAGDIGYAFGYAIGFFFAKGDQLILEAVGILKFLTFF